MLTSLLQPDWLNLRNWNNLPDLLGRIHALRKFALVLFLGRWDLKGRRNLERRRFGRGHALEEELRLNNLLDGLPLLRLLICDFFID